MTFQSIRQHGHKCLALLTRVRVNGEQVQFFEIGRYVPSDGTDAISENRGVPVSGVHWQPNRHLTYRLPGTVGRCVASDSEPRECSLTLPTTNQPNGVVRYGANSGRGDGTKCQQQLSPEPVLESSVRVQGVSGEELEDMVEMTAIPDNGRP
jgi:hypothetical protein